MGDEKTRVEMDEGSEWFWKVTFPLLFVLSMVASLVACSGLLDLADPGRELALRVFILSLGCFGAAHVGGVDTFGVRLTVLAFVSTIVAGLYVTPEGMRGLVSTLFYALVIAAGLFAASSQTPVPQRGVPHQPWFRQGVVYAWAVSGMLLSATRLPAVEHPRPRLPEYMIPGGVQDMVLAHLMDLRVILSVLAGTIVMGTAIGRAMRMAPVDVPDIPRVRLDGLEIPAPVAPLVRPVVRAAVTVWSIVRAPANVLWKALAHVATFLSRIAWHLGKVLIEEVFHPGKMVRIGAQVMCWLLLLVLVRGSGAAAAILLEYLRETGGTTSAIPVLSASFIMALVGATLVVRLVDYAWLSGFDERHSTVNRALECGLILLLVFALADLTMHFVVRRFDALRVEGFTRVGSVTVYALIAFVLVILPLMMWNVWARRTAVDG